MIIKELEWIGSSKKDLRSLSDEIRDRVGYALYEVQTGKQPDSAKVLKGFGSAGVLEIIDKDRHGTYRAVYTVKFKDIIFVLHVFQKKSKQGIKTPKADIDLINSRLKQAQQMYNNITKKS